MEKSGGLILWMSVPNFIAIIIEIFHSGPLRWWSNWPWECHYHPYRVTKLPWLKDLPGLSFDCFCEEKSQVTCSPSHTQSGYILGQKHPCRTKFQRHEPSHCLALSSLLVICSVLPRLSEWQHTVVALWGAIQTSRPPQHSRENRLL